MNRTKTILKILNHSKFISSSFQTLHKQSILDLTEMENSGKLQLSDDDFTGFLHTNLVLFYHLTNNSPSTFSDAFALCHFVLIVSTTFIFTPHINVNCTKAYKQLLKKNDFTLLIFFYSTSFCIICILNRQLSFLFI